LAITNQENLKVLSSILKQMTQDAVKNTTSSGNLQIVTAIKVLDYAFILGHSSHIVSKKEQQYWHRVFRFYTQGFYDFAIITFKELSGISLIPSKIPKNLIEDCLAELKELGDIAILKRFVEVAYHENAKCSFNKGKYRIEFPPNISAIELIETRSQAWLRDYLLSCSNIQSFMDMAHVLLPKTRLLENGIYDEPLLQNLYTNIASAFSETRIGFDYYDPEARFGNVDFKSYRQVVNELIAFATLQQDLYLLNFQKNKMAQTELNFISPIISKKLLIDFLAQRLKLTTTVINQVIETITLNIQKINANIFPPGYAAPILVAINSYQVQLHLTACLTNPYIYLHRCLRFHCKNDYVDAAANREERFKSDVYACFTSPVLKVKTNFVIKDQKKNKTDVDAILYHQREQILVFIQLKWMEDWATDMRLRRNMKTEFERKINLWLDVVDNYLKNENLEELNQRLRLKGVNKTTKVYKLIIGKHFTHFDGINRKTENIYLNWANLFKLLVDYPKCKSSLLHFIQKAKNINIYQEAETLAKAMPDTTFKVGSTEVKLSRPKPTGP